MTRGGRQKDRTSGAERRCIAGGESLPVSCLVRFVLGPDDTITPDLARRLPGRGIWVEARADRLKRAIDKKLFARAARQSVNVPDDLFDRVESGLLRRVIDHLSMARKAGIAVAGFEKVRAALGREDVAVLITASDGSGREASRLWAGEGQFKRISALLADELGLAFGRERVIHAALGGGGITDSFLLEASRLAGLRVSGHDPVHSGQNSDSADGATRATLMQG